MGRLRRRIKRAIQSVRYAITGEYDGTNGNDSITAIGFGGNIYAKGGNDTITVGSISATVYTGTGDDKVYGASGKLTVIDETGNLGIYGAAGFVDISKDGDGDITFSGASGATKIVHEGDAGNIDYAGAALNNNILRSGISGNITFRGAGLGNTILLDTQYGDILFEGAGARNTVKRDWNGDYDNSEGDVTFRGAGASNDVRNLVRVGDIVFVGAGASNYVKREGEGEGEGSSSGDVRFTGAGAYNKIDHGTYDGDTHFTGAGAANIINRYGASGSSGNVYFKGAGGANVIKHTTAYGNTYFTGGGAANIITRSGISGSIIFAGGGAANVVTNSSAYGNIDFNGGGAANVLTRTGKDGDVFFVGGGYGNVITHETDIGDTTFKGAGLANIITRTGNSGDVTFQGAGGANVITHLTATGDTFFQGAGAANVITRSGESGDVTFKGGGLANVITHTTKHGNTLFQGAGGANVVTRVGETGDVTFKGAGVANVITQVVDSGDLNVTAVGGANVVTRTAGKGTANLNLGGGGNVATVTGGGDVNAQMYGGLNVLTTDVDGKTTATLGGHGNIATVLGGDAKIRAVGNANVITTSGIGNDVKAYGSYSIINTLENAKAETETASASSEGGAASGGEQSALHNLGDSLGALLDGGSGASSGDGASPLSALDPILSVLGLGMESGAETTGEASSLSEEDKAELAAKGVDLDARLAAMGHSSSGLNADAPAYEEPDESDFDPQAASDSAKSKSAADYQSLVGEAKQAAMMSDMDALLAGYGGGTASGGMSEDDYAKMQAQASASNGDADEDVDEDEAAKAAEEELKSGSSKFGAGGGSIFDTLGKNYDNGVIAAGAYNIIKTGAENDMISALGLGGNYINSGAGDDGIIALGLGANIIRAGDGNDWAFMLSAANYFEGGDGKDLAIMGGLANIAFMGNGAWDAVVQLGVANVAVKDGWGDFYAVMAGRYNVATAVGDGRAIFVMLGQLNVATKAGDGYSQFIMGGLYNVATQVGDGGTGAIMAGNLNVLTVVGDGVLWGMFLGKLNVVTKVGSGDVATVMAGQANVLTAVNEAGDSAFVAVMGGKLNVATKVGDGTVFVIGVNSVVNAVTQVGDGVFVSLLHGKANVTTKVGNSHVSDGVPGATVMVSYGTLNISTHIGDGTTVMASMGTLNVATKVGDGDMVALLAGQGNLVVHVGDGLLVGGAFASQKTNKTGSSQKEKDLDKSLDYITGAPAKFFLPSEKDTGGSNSSDSLTRLKQFFGMGLASDEKPEKQNRLFDWPLRGIALSDVALGALNGVSEQNVGAAFNTTSNNLQALGGSDLFSEIKEVAANVTVKVGNGDVYFAQVAPGQKDFDDDLGPSPFGKVVDKLPDDVSEMVEKLMSGSTFNVLVQVGDGNTVTAQLGDMNFVIKIGHGDPDAVAGQDADGGWDVVNFALGNFNTVIEVNKDSIFAGGDVYGNPYSDPSKVNRADRSTKSLQVMYGALNTSIKIGDGISIGGMYGDLNVSVKVGHGADYKVMLGNGNLSVRVGSSSIPDADGTRNDQEEFGGLKVLYGYYNVSVDYGTSNDTFLAFAKNRKSETGESSGISGILSDNFSYASTYLSDALGRVGNQSAGKRDSNGLLKDNDQVYSKLVSEMGLPFSSSQDPKKGTKGPFQFISNSLLGFSFQGNIQQKPVLDDQGNPKTNADGSIRTKPANQFQKRSKTQVNKIFDLLDTVGGSLRGKNVKQKFDSNGQPTVSTLSTQLTSNANDAIDSAGEIKQHTMLMWGAVQEAAESGGNIIHAGGGSDFILTVGGGNLVFGDYWTSLFDASLASFMPANGQAISLNEFLGMFTTESGTSRANSAARGISGLVGYLQTFGDIGGTIPYDSFGSMFGTTYDEDGQLTTDFDARQFYSYFVRIFWVEATIPSSIFNFAQLGDLFGDQVGAGVFDFATSLSNTGSETILNSNPEQVIDDFAMNNSETSGPLSWGSASGIPAISSVPNFKSMFSLFANFADIAAVGEGGAIDNVGTFFQNIKPMKDDGDIMVALGMANFQFGGEGDDIMASVGEVGKLFGGSGDDMLFSIGAYSYLAGNEGDDWNFALGVQNVIHDIQGNNSIIAIGDKNDIRTGRGNDFVFAFGDKTKMRMGDGFNFGIIYGNKNSIYLAGDNIVFAFGAENNYYIVGSEGDRSLIYNFGPASITFSPGVKGFVESGGGKIVGNIQDDYISFSRDSEGGDLLGDDRFDLNQQGLDNRSKDTIILRGKDAVAWGGFGGSKDRDHFIVGYGVKDGIIQEAGGTKLGFGDETEDLVVLGERIGVADYSGSIKDAPVQFERSGYDLKIYMPDHLNFEDGTAPLAEGELNSVTVEDYFRPGGDQAAQIVLSVWDEKFDTNILSKWLSEYVAEEADAKAKQEEGGESIQAIHTFSTHSFSNYSYLTRDGVNALLNAYGKLTEGTGTEKWAKVWAQQWNSVVKQGENLEDFKLAQNSGLMIAGDSDANVITGTLNSDTLEGFAGNDTLSGGDGSDILFGGLGDDMLNGGDGSDTAHYGDIKGAVTVDLASGVATGAGGEDTLNSIENVVGTDFADHLTGNGEANLLAGGGGDDVLRGGGGDDEIYGGAGNDTLYGGDGTNSLDGGTGSDTYVIARTDGDAVISDSGNQAGDHDQVVLEEVDHDQIWLSQNGDDLLVSLLGGDSTDYADVWVENWFAEDANGASRVDSFKVGDLALDQGSVQQLVDAMAAWDVTNGVSDDQRRDALQSDVSIQNALAAWVGSPSLAA